MKKTNSKNTTLLLTLSSLFEYYDFVIYGLMSGYLGVLFFPNANPMISQLQAFSLFALGYIVRPLGGMFLAILGDSTDRKKIFIRSNFILAITTLSIAFLPDYQQIGITATIILIILRMLQAASFAVELPGAMSLIQQDSNSPSKNFSFVISATAMGAILATISLYLLENYFSHEEILNFAWRIPFIFGSILCLISALMRNNLPNSPQIAKNKATFIADILPEYKNILSAILIISLPAFLIIMNIFFPTFIPKFYEYEIKEVYLAMTISLIWSAIYSPIFSHLTYKISKLSLLKIIIFLSIFLGLVINFLLLRQGLMHLIIGLCIYQSIITSMMVITFPLMAEMFPSQIRFTLITICYNISYSIMAFSPVFISNLADKWNSPFALWFFLMMLCIFIISNIRNFTKKD